jgi:hypothetical protein
MPLLSLEHAEENFYSLAGTPYGQVITEKSFNAVKQC